MDAITMLKDDHKTVKKLFREFEKADEGRKKRIADQIVEELSVHSALEEQIFYPAARESLPDGDTVLEAVEEHHVVAWICSELMGMDTDDERFEPKVIVMKEMVEHHIKEEEDEMFPKMREALGRKVLQEIGARMEEAKPSMPREPQPRPGNAPVESIISLDEPVPAER